ncbi:MAG: PHP domain-containing protein [Actinomycetota bacterium]
MLNLKLGNILTNIAELFKFSSGSKDMVFPLNKAARSIRDYPRDVRDAYRSGEIWELEGIEKEAAPYIEEFFSTGTIKIYEQIKQRYPEELIKFIRMSGLGEKRVLGIYKALGVSDVGKLKETLYDERFVARVMEADKSPLTPLDVARLKHTIDFYENMQKKHPRGFIENFLPQIIKDIESIDGVERVAVAGSLRRKKPLVGDMDILILPAFNLGKFDAEKSRMLLEKISAVKYIKAKEGEQAGNHNISYRFRTELGADLEAIVTTAARFAADLFTATGSKKHVRKVLNILGDKGQDIYSLGTEEDIYRLAGLEYVPCELREDKGEVEWAAAGKIPQLVNLQDIKGDLHIHSSFSDGLIEIEDIIERIDRYSYRYVALTDHSQSNIYGNGLDEKRLAEKIDYTRQLSRQVHGARLLVGSEVDIRDDGSLDYDSRILRKLDIVIASMHSSFRNGSGHNTGKAVSGLSNRHVDFLAHPTGIVFDNRAPYFIDVDRIIEAAGKYNKALEINSYFLRLDLDDENVRKAGDAGVKLVINTDSHRPNNLDNMRLGVDIARRAGLTAEDIINTWPYERILEWKRDR